MTQSIFSKAISSSPLNKSLRSYLCHSSVGRQGKKIEYSKRDQDLHTKKESFGKALIRTRLGFNFFKTFSLKNNGF